MSDSSSNVCEFYHIHILIVLSFHIRCFSSLSDRTGSCQVSSSLFPFSSLVSNHIAFLMRAYGPGLLVSLFLLTYGHTVQLSSLPFNVPVSGLRSSSLLITIHVHLPIPNTSIPQRGLWNRAKSNAIPNSSSLPISPSMPIQIAGSRRIKYAGQCGFLQGTCRKDPLVICSGVGGRIRYQSHFAWKSVVRWWLAGGGGRDAGQKLGLGPDPARRSKRLSSTDLHWRRIREIQRSISSPIHHARHRHACRHITL
jgi:hypothetical protein